jgi:hypothetical protein
LARQWAPWNPSAIGRADHWRQQAGAQPAALLAVDFGLLGLADPCFAQAHRRRADRGFEWLPAGLLVVVLLAPERPGDLACREPGDDRRGLEMEIDRRRLLEVQELLVAQVEDVALHITHRRKLEARDPRHRCSGRHRRVELRLDGVNAVLLVLDRINTGVDPHPVALLQADRRRDLDLVAGRRGEAQDLEAWIAGARGRQVDEVRRCGLDPIAAGVDTEHLLQPRRRERHIVQGLKDDLGAIRVGGPPT